MGLDKYMSTADVAAYVGIHKSTINRMIKRGDITFAFQIGKFWRFKKEDVDAWADSLKKPEKPTPKEEGSIQIEDEKPISWPTGEA